MIITDWQARHGLNALDYQHTFDRFVSQGYRLVKVSGYAVHNQARYTGIWYRCGGNAWEARHGISEAAYQQAVTDLGAQGYRPTHISVFSLGDQPLFSAIWEQEKGLIWSASHNLTSDEYQRLFDDMSRRGYRLRCVSGYEMSGEARYACIWDFYAGPAWQARHGLDAWTYQHEFDTLNAQGYRLVQVVGYPIQGTPRFAAIWEQSSGHGWQARHGIPADNYQTEFDSMVQGGFRLVDVSGYGFGSSSGYTSLWEDASADRPTADPVSELIIPLMQKWAIPGLSLAVARQGMFLSSRCFGYVNPITREIVTPEHRFRIASVTKPITATAIFQLIEQGRLFLTDKIFGTGTILGTQFGTLPYGFGIEEITIQHLLKHTAGGWAKGGNDPMFQSPDLNQSDLISWTLDTQPLLYQPGTAWLYSNFGYCLLGRVIEAVTGMPYTAYIQKYVLQPCGITEMTIAGNTAMNRQPFEAMYAGKDLDAPYELLISRMDSHGGWIASPTDLLRFLLKVDSFPMPC
ncbi:MAG TPA: serine hydrolase [Methylobacter sp.]|jgi:hypothetical protein